MQDRSLFLFRVLSWLSARLSSYGCALSVRRTARVTRDRAFISYSPARNDSGKLRLAVKDIIDMKGKVTTAGSRYLAVSSPPAQRDAECLRNARRSDVIIVGKTNLTEFALGMTGMNEFYGTPINPLGRYRIPGGSSSGSAVAVANGEADVAFGSDTTGSIRVPAACCGILGLKTTFGLVPLQGVFPLSPKHLDTIGPMAVDVARLAKGMELLDREFLARYEAIRVRTSSAKQITIGRLYVVGTNPRIDQAIDRALATAGFRLVRLHDDFRDHWDQAQSNGTVLAVADSWLNECQYLGETGVTLTTQANIRFGELQYNTTYQAAVDAKPGWQGALNRAFTEVDFIALPTLKTLPPRKSIFGRSTIFEARVLGLQNTAAVNYAGNPAIAIPVPFQKRGFPVTSLQLIGPSFSEAALVNAARLIMKADQGTFKETARRTKKRPGLIPVISSV